MDKEGLIRFVGTVRDVLPDNRFNVELDNGHRVLAYVSGTHETGAYPCLGGRPGNRRNDTIRSQERTDHIPRKVRTCGQTLS